MIPELCSDISIDMHPSPFPALPFMAYVFVSFFSFSIFSVLWYKCFLVLRWCQNFIYFHLEIRRKSISHTYLPTLISGSRYSLLYTQYPFRQCLCNANKTKWKDYLWNEALHVGIRVVEPMLLAIQKQDFALKTVECTTAWKTERSAFNG